ncbi:pyridoxine/pyridoxamine 5'-phosphate oxidase [Streptomyces sudanensis]|uniref:pyridoxine/pyridoxamine 5'-phosphate oxidase n=1 Tax=Streptomyces sudanensis TaxID=436397 RepID=UPI0020CF7A1B|nr:pyridoxal 5'-phosphate synthase [Streptomyces sudanensis]MCP9958529.1 pyridoxal 5'-phosphate synthase [Streptomyces sudanensis]MCQ0000961.1 pyridoxal 5'-phosphate synthase [Streptomyces sudanensis]
MTHGTHGTPGTPGTSGPHATHAAFEAALHALRVWDTDLPAFDPLTAPDDPLDLFHAWFLDAAEAGQPEPHTMQLATAGADGRPDVRTVMLHGADGHGWRFATHSTSAKGRQLAARPYAALHFYWPLRGRQVRLRGPVAPGTPEEARADLRARSTGALAAALTGRQSAPLASPRELAEASARAWERAGSDPAAEAPTWTVYRLAPREAEFFQGDARRRHVRLRYDRASSAAPWSRGLLWP